MAIPSLLNTFVDETYQRLVQTTGSGAEFADGLGNPITFGTTPTGSLLVTASVTSNTITFTKGDGSTFPITVNTGSATAIDNYVTTSSFNAFTSSINSFTSSYNSGSFTGSFTGQLIGTASWAVSSSQAISSSYAANGGVTQLLAGPNITLSPTNGLGQVTITAAGGGTSYNTATGSYGSFYDTTTQSASLANTGYPMSLNTTDISNGVAISGSNNTYIKTTNAGIYNVQFSAQLARSVGSGTETVLIWLRKNGLNLSWTNTEVTFAGGTNIRQVAAWNWFVSSAANDAYEIMWSTTSTNIVINASTTPDPDVPSVIATVNRVDQFLSNTGSFSGSFNGSFTGSLFGTASWATNAITSSYPIAVTGSTLYSIAPLSTNNPSPANNIILGESASAEATSGQSIFIGTQAGYKANAGSSIIIGSAAGYNALYPGYCTFVGLNAGALADYVGYSNFIGISAGFRAVNASYSNFLGQNAGYDAANASYSTLIGYQAGYNRRWNAFAGIGRNNIIIGTNITLEEGRQDSINIGGILFATGSYFNTGSVPFSGSAGGKIGINVITPTRNFEVSGSVAFNSLTTANQSNVVTIDTATGQLYYTASSAFGGTGSPIAVTGSTLYSTSPLSTLNPKTSNNIFFGTGSGDNLANVSNSIFLGPYAGQSAIYANNSNFLGYEAGRLSTNASQSNFLGYRAGYYAFYPHNSNFFGREVGNAAHYANNSNFLGNQAGSQATYANNSNFIGSFAGYNGTYADNSNFLGQNAGVNASNASGSNFLGNTAGYQATDANSSNFLGTNAGDSATYANNSNFLGTNAGISANQANNSNFLGLNAGSGSTSAFKSNFLGGDAGILATDANGSNFLGYTAGSKATRAFQSNFLGPMAGRSATDANNSNFLGYQAGDSATNANNSNFLGQSAGAGANSANISNFFGQNAGFQASSAGSSNFLGFKAGEYATNANSSNFLGNSAGINATTAQDSNFLGSAAGGYALNAEGSNFFGPNAGYYAINANRSVFIGVNSGLYSGRASYSTLIGYNAGRNYTNNFALGVKSNNIIIGTNITLEQDRQDSINIGGIIFGTGSYSTITGNPFSGSANGKIGINIINPQYSLDVSGSSRLRNGLIANSAVSFPDLTDVGSNYVVTYDPLSGQLYYTGSAAFVSGASAGQNPGGVTYNVQYNNAGNFAGDSGFTYRPNNELVVSGAAVLFPTLTEVNQSYVVTYNTSSGQLYYTASSAIGGGGGGGGGDKITITNLAPATSQSIATITPEAINGGYRYCGVQYYIEITDGGDPAIIYNSRSGKLMLNIPHDYSTTTFKFPLIDESTEYYPGNYNYTGDTTTEYVTFKAYWDSGTNHVNLDIINNDPNLFANFYSQNVSI